MERVAKNDSYIEAMRTLQNKVRELVEQNGCLEDQLRVKQDVIDSLSRDVELANEQVFKKNR
jgi:hypothetical protein